MNTSTQDIPSIDPRLLNLSYSGLLNAHSCPRKYQLSRLNATKDQEESFESSITFSFGHVVGEGIALAFEGKTEQEIIWAMYLRWKPDLFAENPKQQKSFWFAVAAVQRLLSMREYGYLEEWELVYYEGKPAVELGFAIELPNNYRYRGFVDAVLRNKLTGAIMVLECKTSSATNLNPAQYKNSAQAIGYSIVLDHIFPALSSYEVLYLVYVTKTKDYEQLPFSKSYLQRALWLQELLLDVEILGLYESSGVYPMRGESCFTYFRECEYLQTCTLSTELLTKPETAEDVELRLQKEKEYTIVVDFKDLIRSQLSKE